MKIEIELFADIKNEGNSNEWTLRYDITVPSSVNDILERRQL